MNTIAKGLLRGVGFLANVILDGMNQDDKEEENTAPAMDAMNAMARATYQPDECAQELAIFNRIHGFTEPTIGTEKLDW